MAFNHLKTMKDAVEYMKRYETEPDSYDFHFLLKDESIDFDKKEERDAGPAGGDFGPSDEGDFGGADSGDFDFEEPEFGEPDFEEGEFEESPEEFGEEEEFTEE